MASLKAIKRRIASVRNTQQIMKAMNLVATSKLQRSKTRMEGVRPLFASAQAFFETGCAVGAEAASHFFATPSRTGRTAYIIIAGERGLCGSYNANVQKEALAHMEGRRENSEKIFALGAKARDFFTRRDKNVVESITNLEKAAFADIAPLARQLAALYTSGQVDEIFVVYTRFESILSHVATVQRLLPLPAPSQGTAQTETTYEPSPAAYFRHAVPEYLSLFLYGAVVEAAACGQAARMTSMDAASRNAGEILDKLTLEYNRKRQSAITQEISEIVGGANAL